MAKAVCESTFDCWEGHFNKNRTECIECTKYVGCVRQEMLDLHKLLREQKKLKEKKK